MKLDVIKTGNSRGIRIHKSVIEQCGFGASVEAYIDGGGLVITRERVPARRDWPRLFKAARNPAGELLMEDGLPNQFDDQEWDW